MVVNIFCQKCMTNQRNSFSNWLLTMNFSDTLRQTVILFLSSIFYRCFTRGKSMCASFLYVHAQTLNNDDNDDDWQ